MKNKIRLSKKLFVTILTVALIATGSFIYYTHRHKSSGSGGNSGLEQPINYGPPTASEQAAGDQQKKDNENKTNQQQASPGTKKQTTPFISNWSQNAQSGDVEVNGFLTDVYEAGGTCVLTMRKGSTAVTTSRAAYKDAQTTNCGLLAISRTKLTAGNWQITLSYSSKTAQGDSKPVNLDVK